MLKALRDRCLRISLLKRSLNLYQQTAKTIANVATYPKRAITPTNTASKDGVLLVSSATTAVNLNLLSVGLQALEISERAEQIQRNLGRLSRAISEVGDTWTTLRSHITNAYNKAGQVNDRYNRLKVVFERITQQEEKS